MVEKDPVCLKGVETNTTHIHFRYKIREFYFCSEGCAAEFQQHPDVFYQIEA